MRVPPICDQILRSRILWIYFFFLSLSFQFENFRCTRVTSFLQLDAAVTRCLDKVCAGRQATEDNSAEWLLHLQQQQQSHSELLLGFSSRSVFDTSAFYPTTTNRTFIEAPLPLPDEFTTERNKAKKADTASFFFSSSSSLEGK